MTQPIIFQRLEGLALFAYVLVAATRLNQPWWLLIIIFFAFDLSALGYLISNRVGAITYNIGHSLVIPFGLWAYFSLPLWRPAGHAGTYITVAALMMLGHIGFDRMLGYGLKESDGFNHTHLGMIGRKPRA